MTLQQIRTSLHQVEQIARTHPPGDDVDAWAADVMGLGTPPEGQQLLTLAAVQDLIRRMDSDLDAAITAEIRTKVETMGRERARLISERAQYQVLAPLSGVPRDLVAAARRRADDQETRVRSVEQEITALGDGTMTRHLRGRISTAHDTWTEWESVRATA